MKNTFSPLRKLMVPILAGSIALALSACDGDSSGGGTDKSLGANDNASEITSPTYDSSETTVDHDRDAIQRAEVPDVMNAGVMMLPVNRTRNDSVPRNFCIGSYSQAGFQGQDGQDPVTVSFDQDDLVYSWEGNRGARFPLSYVKSDQYLFLLEGSNPLPAMDDIGYAATLRAAINEGSTLGTNFRAVLQGTNGVYPDAGTLNLIAYGSATHYGLFNVTENGQAMGSLVYIHPTEDYLYYLERIQYQFRSTSTEADLLLGMMEGQYNTLLVEGFNFEFKEYFSVSDPLNGGDAFSRSMNRAPYSLEDAKALEAQWIPVLSTRNSGIMNNIAADSGNGTYTLQGVTP